MTNDPRTEQEWADYYQEHKDDPAVWGSEEPRDPPRRDRNLSVTMTVRFAPEEAAIIRQVAKERGSTYSEVVRGAIRLLGEPALPTKGSTFTFVLSENSRVSPSEPELIFGNGFRAGDAPTTGVLRPTG